MNYTSSMHTLLKEQLLGNFEHSAQHVETKHKMEQVYYNPIVVVFCDTYNLQNCFCHAACYRLETLIFQSQEHCRRMLTVREARLLREQEVDRNSIPKKLKHDRKKRMVEVVRT